MQLNDITVEVRDKALARIGQIRPEDLNLAVEEVFNNVGKWTLKLSPEHPMADVLRTPGSGIIVAGPADVLFSGPTTNPVYERDSQEPGGLLTFEGVTDDVILQDHLSLPQPSNPDMTTQNAAHDTRTGKAEDLLHAYVNANIGPSAPAARRKANLTMGANQHRGPSLTKSPRFPVLGELLSEIALAGNLGFRIVQRGSALVFETWEVIDRSPYVRLDTQTGSQKVMVSPPKVTRVLVAGQEQGVNRQFVYRDSTISLAAEAEWGRRIEKFLDQRQTDVIAELQQAGDELLAESGFTAIAAQATPSDDEATMRFGIDWYLGDKVAVVVEDQELSAIVTGMVLKAGADGFRVGAQIGDPSKFDWERSTVRRVSAVETRVSQIEQNVEPVDTTADLANLAAGVAMAAPTGVIVSYGGSVAPTGWHLCDGTAHGSAALQAVLGSTNTPDLRDRFIVGAGSSYARGATGGEATHTLTVSEMPAHKHDVGLEDANGTFAVINRQQPGGSHVTGWGFEPTTTSGSWSRTWVAATQGGGAAHENRPPYYALVYIIKK